jgi:hypothetical protein
MKYSDYKQASALKQKMRRHNDKVNKPVTINDLIVYPADPSINGEFNQPQQQSTSQSQEDRIARMTAEIRRLADFAVANHTQTSAGNNVTRIATPEFFFYTNPPLSQEEYSTLIQNIETMAAQLPQDIHMILGSFHLEHTSGALLNSTIHVQTGPQPEINAFAKNTVSHVDPASDTSRAFNQNPVRQDPSQLTSTKHNQELLNFKPKAFTGTEDSSVISNYPLIRCTAASGAEFITAVDVCLDNYMAHAAKILVDNIGTQDNLIPTHCSHVIVSNTISKSDHAQITEGGIVHHVDAWPSEQNGTPLDARNLQRFHNSIPLNVPFGDIKSLAFRRREVILTSC